MTWYSACYLLIWFDMAYKLDLGWYIGGVRLYSWWLMVYVWDKGFDLSC